MKQFYIILLMLLCYPLLKAQDNLFYYAGNEIYPLTFVPNKRASLRQPSINNSINYVEMIPLLVQTIQKLSAEVTELKKQK